jgi:hypothetical protein
MVISLSSLSFLHVVMQTLSKYVLYYNVFDFINILDFPILYIFGIRACSILVPLVVQGIPIQNRRRVSFSFEHYFGAVTTPSYSRLAM